MPGRRVRSVNKAKGAAPQDRPLPQSKLVWAQAAFLASRRRLSTAAAAAPNRISIGGAGTSWPPFEVLVLVEPPVLVEVDEEPEVDEDELVDVDEEVELEPEVELDEVTLPEVDELVDVEDDEETLPEVELDELTLPEVEDEDVTLPDDEDEVEE